MISSAAAATMIFGLAAVILTHIVWVAFYRGFRKDRFAWRLRALRDQAFDAALIDGRLARDAAWQNTVAWLESLSAAAPRLTPVRFVLLYARADSLPATHPDLLPEFLDDSMTIVRRYLAAGCWPLGLWFVLRPDRLDRARFQTVIQQL